MSSRILPTAALSTTLGAAGGHVAQVRALYRENSPALYRVLARLGAARSEPADLLQDVFVVALRRADSLCSARSPRAWLFGVALKVAADSRRNARLRQLLSLSWVFETATEATPAIELERAERAAEVHAALGRLSATRREVLVLFEFEGLSGQEIADALGCPLATVWTRLHHARQALERELKTNSRVEEGP